MLRHALVDFFFKERQHWKAKISIKISPNEEMTPVVSFTPWFEASLPVKSTPVKSGVACGSTPSGEESLFVSCVAWGCEPKVCVIVETDELEVVEVKDPALRISSPGNKSWATL